jgi:hypothetical protein
MNSRFESLTGLESTRMSSDRSPADFDQDFNPYAPPKAKLDGSLRPTSQGLVPFDLGCIVSATWRSYKERFLSCMGICLTVFTLVWVAQYMQRRVGQELIPAQGDLFGTFLARFVPFICVYIFSTWLTIGQNLALLRIGRGEPQALEQVFRGGRFVLTTMLAGVVFVILLGLIGAVNLIWVPILAGLVGTGAPMMVLVIALAVVIAFISGGYVAARFSQFHFMIIDQNAGVIDSLRFSWESTRGCVGTLFLVFTLLFVINLAGLLACLVGVLFTAPFTSLMLAVAYLSLTNQPIGGESRAREIWYEDSRLSGDELE